MKIPYPIVAWMVLAVLLGTNIASAQQPGRTYKIGWLAIGSQNEVIPPPESWTGLRAAFRDYLRDHGFVVGKNVVIDLRDAQGDVTRLPALAEALVATQPDVLVTMPATAPTIAAMRATKTIPIVFAVGNPVGRGIVKSLVNHGGNATGQAGNVSNSRIWQLLRDAVPTLRRAGYVGYAPNNFAQDRSPEYRARRMAALGRESAQSGLELVDLLVDRFDELEPKIAAFANGGEAGLVFASDPVFFSWRAEIMSMAMRYRLPVACDGWGGWDEAGALITYGEDFNDVWRRAAAQVVKIFNGTKPADIPIEQPTKFILILNAKTAKALDLTLPRSLLAVADKVIE